MVLDFMTVAAFVLLCAHKLAITLLSMSASVVSYLKLKILSEKEANKISRHQHTFPNLTRMF